MGWLAVKIYPEIIISSLTTERREHLMIHNYLPETVVVLDEDVQAVRKFEQLKEKESNQNHEIVAAIVGACNTM